MYSDYIFFRKEVDSKVDLLLSRRRSVRVLRGLVGGGCIFQLVALEMVCLRTFLTSFLTSLAFS